MQPIWHRLESADCKTDVAGELLIKVGFIPLSSSNASSRLPSLLSPSQRSSLLAALKSVNDEVEGLGRRDSREERVLLTSPVESSICLANCSAPSIRMHADKFIVAALLL